MSLNNYMSNGISNHIIIVTDIFGVTEQIKQLCQHWQSLGLACSVVDPYQGQLLGFSSEAKAYEYFIKQCGHPQYLALLNNEIASIAADIIIVGFSAGASAAWQAVAQQQSSQSIAKKLQHFIGFYPSHIRHHLSLRAQCPTTLVFPAQEPHFDVCHCMEKLSVQPFVQTIQLPNRHGFINHHSSNYQKSAADNVWQLLQQAPLLANIASIRLKLSDLSA